MRRLHLMVSMVLFATTAAFAQNNRSAVSVIGSDLNSCAPTAPCRTFSVALSHTNPGGEVIALDSGGFGPFTVTKSVTVSGAPGVHAGVTATGVSAIVVSLSSPTDVVFLRNLVVLAGGGGLDGISTSNVGSIHVVNCLIRGFVAAGGSGIQIGGAEAVIDRVFVEGNARGIALLANSAFRVRITDSQIDGNSTAGIEVGENARVVVSNTSLSRNAVGLRVVSTSNSVSADATAFHCVISGNQVGIYAEAPDASQDATVRLYGTLISYNSGAGIQAGPSFIYTHGNNVIRANNPDLLGAVLTPLAQQ